MKKVIKRIFGVIFTIIGLLILATVINDVISIIRGFIFVRSSWLSIIIRTCIAIFFGVKAWEYLDKDFDEEN